MDDLLLKAGSLLKDRELQLKPFKFASLSKQFLEPVVFPTAEEPKNGKVTIIVLNRNGEQHLHKFFSSFISFNTYQDYEFIVIDHDSDDISLEIIESYRQQVNIRLFPLSTNFTYSYSNNFAAGKSDAEYLFFLNTDIIFDQDVIGSLVEIMKVHPEAGIIAPALYYPDENFNRSAELQHSGIRFIYRQKCGDHIRYLKTDPPSFKILKYKNSHLFRDVIVPFNSHESGKGITSHPALCAAAILCRRDDFLAAGGFNENYIYGYEDVDLSLVIQNKPGTKLFMANDLGMIHNESYTRKKEGMYKSSLKIHNLLMLTYRFGYYIRIRYLKDLFAGTGYWTDQHPVVAVITSDNISNKENIPLKTKFLSTLFTQRLKWETRLIRNMETAAGIKDADIIINTDSKLPVADLSGTKDTLVSIKWMENGEHGFSFEKAYERVFEKLLKQNSNADETLTDTDFPDPDPFLEFIINRIQNHLNVAVKLPVGTGNTDEGPVSSNLFQSISTLLADDRCTLRTDLPAHWYDRGIFADQVVISFPGEHVYYPQPGQINVLWLTEDDKEVELSLVDFYDLIFLQEGIKNHPLLKTERSFTKKIIRSALFDNLMSVHREKAGI
jgi:GT2 family glycosyltransferase